MKNFSHNDQMSLTVNGATIVPELARTLTKKRNGHHVSLRVTYNRVILALLPTEIYVAPTLFNAKTKQCIEPTNNEQLKALLGTASRIVATTLTADAIKKEWEKERNKLEQESAVDTMELFADWQNLTSLYAKRTALEKQLVEINATITAMEKESGLTPLPTVGIMDTNEYKKAKDEFILSIGGRSKRDVQAFNTFFNDLDKYATFANIQLGLQSFDYQFYLAYGKYCFYTLDNYNNTFGAKIKKLKQFLKYCEENGYTVNKGYKDKRFKILEEEKDVIYLDDEELEMIWSYKNVNPAYANVIDLLVFQSLTGLRVSDAMRKHHTITKKNEKFVTGVCKKNKGVFLIPVALDNRTEEILSSHNYNMELMSEGNYNKEMKELIKAAYAFNGLEVPKITYTRDKGKDTIEFTEPKNELISSHSMRRGFCTRHLNSGHFNETDVLEMLGSTDLKELQKYITVESDALNKKANASRTSKAA